MTQTPEIQEPAAVWSALDATLDAEFAGMARSLPRTCTLLLYNAVAAYDARAYEAVAITCRASIEAACWHYQYLGWSRNGWTNRGIPRNKEGQVSQTQLSDLWKEVRRSRVITPKMDDWFRHVKLAGDSTAHIAEVTLREAEASLRKWAKASIRSRVPVPAPGRDPIEPGWVGEREARSLISDTADLLLVLFHASAERSRREHPEWFKPPLGSGPNQL